MEAYKELENRLSVWSGCQNVVSCSSGTAALHLAFEALQLPPGSQVIVPEFTMVACARAVTMAGLEPIFVDCGDDLLMDIEQVEDYITSSTSAILVVHIYGRVCDMERIRGIAAKYELSIVEDLAEAHGVIPDYHTQAACWSFYKNKIVCGEEGGAVAFSFRSDMEFAEAVRCQGFTEKHDFLHTPRGHNYRLSNANAKLILESLAQVEENLAKRRQVEAWYDEAVPQEFHMPPRRVPWVYDLYLTNPKLSLGSVVWQLNKLGIAARHSFKPMSEQPEYLGHYKHLNAYRTSRRVLYLPIHPSLTKDVVEQYADRLMEIIRE